jgi:hypothetical protein
MTGTAETPDPEHRRASAGLKRAAIVAGAAAAVALALASTTSAATFVVTNTNDSGPASLRAAISYANAVSDADTIVIKASGAIQLQTALPDLNTDLAIVGPGNDVLSVHGCNTQGCVQQSCHIICFYGLPTTFVVSGGAHVALRDLSITGDGSITGGGSCPCFQGGVDNAGTLSLEHVQVYNTSVFAINNLIGGTLTVGQSVVRSSGFSAIYNRGSVAVRRSTFAADGCGQGGVLNNGGGRMGVSRSSIYNTDCIGIENDGGTTNVELTTVSSGSQTGIYNRRGTVSIVQSTLVGSRAPTIVNDPQNGPTTTTIKSTILEHASQDCPGGVISKGHNISNGDTTYCLTTATDKPYTDPLLKPLGSYGGPTETYALQPTSPAIDAGFAGRTTTDQRGRPRIVDYPGVPNTAGSDNSDIGAFELQSP